jgi:hypothetical protein
MAYTLPGMASAEVFIGNGFAEAAYACHHMFLNSLCLAKSVSSVLSHLK